ncbi:cyclophilin-like fold protein [Myxococcus xanthus]|uniref:cyclophilin-like fold protein n=1 Tax=Myxococcus xanthus TaxID=34 RepID=UPI001CEDBAA9|nr:cyclophilin-like fold protein [Myxococcus xanthus]
MLRAYLPTMRKFSLAFFCLLAGCACTNQPSPQPDDLNPSIPPMAGGEGGDDAGTTPNPASTDMRITIGPKSFTVKLHNSETATAFKSILPVTANMTDLNANEKYYRLPSDLPVNASNPGTIQAGDVMLYGSNTLVLFYKTFSTSYSYTRIGKVENASELAATLGSGNVTVMFE